MVKYFHVASLFFLNFLVGLCVSKEVTLLNVRVNDSFMLIDNVNKHAFYASSGVFLLLAACNNMLAYSICLSAFDVNSTERYIYRAIVLFSQFPSLFLITSIIWASGGSNAYVSRTDFLIIVILAFHAISPLWAFVFYHRKLK